MAELTIDPTTIRKALDEFVESYTVSYTHLTLPTTCDV